MNTLAILGCAGLAAVAAAGPLSAGPGGGGARVADVPNIADDAEVWFSRTRSGCIVHIRFDKDIASMDGLGDPDNVVLALDLGFGGQITVSGVGWDVDLQTVGGSWLSEAAAYFDDNVAPDSVGLILTPGIADGHPGAAGYSSGGIVDLSDHGIPDIVLPDGVLRLEFYESFVDHANAPDAFWLAGSVLRIETNLLIDCCPADLNDDGELNFFDVQEFLDLFAANDLAADLTEDGVFDFFDVALFLDAFSAGCP